MAALTSSPSGFSYAQAAKGHASATTSQTSSSKVTSGTATPATGQFSDLGPARDWADDVEANEGDKPIGSSSRKVSQDQTKPPQPKDSAVERTKSESRAQNGTSGMSSPDLAASSTTTTNTDDSSAAPNGTPSSDTTWDTKSITSEPAWIAERKERQTGAHTDETSTKGKRTKKDPAEGKEPALPQAAAKPIVLQEATPPAVNPWAQRMHQAKPSPSQTSTSVPSERPNTNENQAPKADARKKSNSVASAVRQAEPRPATEAKTAGAPQGDASSEAGGAASARTVQREHSSLPNLSSTVPPPVKDEMSWPTPETAQENQRKDVTADKGTAKESGDPDATPTAKPHQKTKWQPVAVTPTIVWQTEEMNRPPRGQGGERGGRGGSAGRGRGAYRGTPPGAKASDRASAKNVEQDVSGGSASRGRSDTVDRAAMPPPPKPAHRSSHSGSRDGRRSGEQSSTERRSHGKSASSAVVIDGTSNGIVMEPIASFPKMDSAGPNNHEDVKQPEPIPRRSTHGAEDGREAEGQREASFIRKVTSDSRKERPYESFNGKEWTGAPRGGKRNGRGRGGAAREYNNGHQSSQIFTNGDYAANLYGVPPSPSAYQAPRGHFGFAPISRGGWPRTHPRSQSIPIEQAYGSRPYWPYQQMGSMQTYYPGMYDHNGMPMTAMPYNAMVDHNYLAEMVSTQLEYYFSLDNLLKDMFLRKNMDGKGLVLLDVIANFNRIKQLTQDRDLLRSVCLHSKHIEILVGEDGKERLRRREGWDQFLLPKEQREASAANDGPSMLQQPEVSPPAVWSGYAAATRGPSSAGLPRRSYDSGYHMNGSVAQFSPFSPNGDQSNDLLVGEEMRGRAAKSPMRDSNGSSHHALDLAGSKDMGPDVFPEEQIGTLTVVVKTNAQRSQHHHAASRTFSNGSIDTRSIASELEKAKETTDTPSTNGELKVNGEHEHTATPRHSSPNAARSPGKNVNSELMLLWVKDKELPQEKMPENSTLEPYWTLRHKALSQREQAATGNCPYDLDVLYQFWSHFLIRNFNNRMYGEFKYFAHDDAKTRESTVGLQNLVQFYAKALASSNPIRDTLVQDYVDLVKSEPPILKGLAFQQLRKAWRNGALNLKNRKKLADIVDEPLKAQLES